MLLQLFCLQFLNSPNLSFNVGLSATPLRRCTVTAQSTPLQQQAEQEKENSPGLLSTPYSFPMQPTKLSLMNRNSDPDHSTPSKARRCLADPMPRTPTPFKNALAELEKNGGIAKYMVEWSFILLIYTNQSRTV